MDRNRHTGIYPNQYPTSYAGSHSLHPSEQVRLAYLERDLPHLVGTVQRIHDEQKTVNRSTTEAFQGLQKQLSELKSQVEDLRETQETAWNVLTFLVSPKTWGTIKWVAAALIALTALGNNDINPLASLWALVTGRPPGG